jgi:hypothetical protein
MIRNACYGCRRLSGCYRDYPYIPLCLIHKHKKIEEIERLTGRNLLKTKIRHIVWLLWAILYSYTRIKIVSLWACIRDYPSRIKEWWEKTREHFWYVSREFIWGMMVGISITLFLLGVVMMVLNLSLCDFCS